MKKKARTLLQQVLLQHLEQEISQIPEEQEIRKQHSFSNEFAENMNDIAGYNGYYRLVKQGNKIVNALN